MSGMGLSLLAGPQYAGLLTAGVSTGLVGFSSPGGFGSLNGQSAFGGSNISFILDDSTGTPVLNIGIVANVAQTFFTGILINGKVYLTAGASSFTAAATSTWKWNAGAGGLAGMVNGGVYPYVLF